MTVRRSLGNGWVGVRGFLGTSRVVSGRKDGGRVLVTGLEAAAAAAAKAVVQRAGREWLATRAAREDGGRDLSELLQVSFPDRFARRKLERQLADIADSVERRLDALIRVEFSGLAGNDRAAVFASVTAALERADLSDAALLNVDMDPVRLARQVRVRMPGMARDLGEAGARLYDLALDECCDCLVRIILQLPAFIPRAEVEALSRLSGIGDQVSAVLERLPARTLDAPAGTGEDREFERRYREHLSGTLDEIELFGVRVESYQPRAVLSAAYISLSVTAEETGSQRPGSGPLKFSALTSAQEAQRAPMMRAETALARYPRTLLRGQAGSGKSTLLRWITVTAARGGFTGSLSDWNGRVPFLIKLRSHADGALPGPDDFAGGPISGLMPPGWAHRVLGQGRGLILADGVDELPPAARPAVRQWLRDLLAAYPSTRAVISSRPAAAESRWLATEGFLPVTLEPMGPGELRELIRQWHAAIRHATALPCAPEELPGYERALLGRLESGPHLRALASTPLLAAMMCALNLDRRQHLPRDRMGLYAAVLDMLLERRDAERGIPTSHGITLDREQKARILEDLAWQLTVFGRTEMSAATARKRVADKTATMPRMTAPPAAVLEHLLQRSGVIREPVPGRVDFVHHTIQEYLAAAQAADNADMEPLITRAHLDQWRETVIMAAGHANAPLRAQLLAGLLDRADAEPRYARRLRLLTAGCLETIPDLPSQLCERIDACMATLIPPRTAAECRPLAGAGQETLRRLPASITHLPAREAAATVRTAWLINGPAALDRLAGYAADPRPEVQDELISGWSYFDPHEYARRVLANAPLHRGRLDINYDPGLLPAVPLLRKLRKLRVALPGHVDLDCLNGLPALTQVRANGAAAASLPALAEHHSLRGMWLQLDGTVDDISPLLAFRQLRELYFLPKHLSLQLDFVGHLPALTGLLLSGLDNVTDFSPLYSHPALRCLGLYHCPGLTAMDALPPHGALRILGLGRAGLTAGSLAAIVEKYPRLRVMELLHNTWITDLKPLAGLPLKSLTVRGSSQLSNIEPIAHLSELTFLDIGGDIPVSDLAPIAGLKKLQHLMIGNSTRTLDLSPIGSLPRLRQLDMGDMTDNTDVSPLGALRNLRIFMREGQQVRCLGTLHPTTRITWVPRVDDWID